jgi:hypothetical protein
MWPEEKARQSFGLLNVKRGATEHLVNDCIEDCRTPVRHSDTPRGDLLRLPRGYAGNAMASHDMVIDVEHDVSRDPPLLIVEGAQNRCTNHAQYRAHMLRIFDGSEQRPHRHFVIEPRDSDRDSVFTHGETYTPVPGADQISSARSAAAYASRCEQSDGARREAADGRYNCRGSSVAASIQEEERREMRKITTTVET